MLSNDDINGIVLPDGSIREAEKEENKPQEEGKYTKIFPLSYYDFARANNVQVLGTETMNKWIDSITQAYQYDCKVDEVKRFFHIEGNEKDEDIRLRKYKITTFVTGHDTERKTLILKLIMKFQDESMYLGLIDKMK